MKELELIQKFGQLFEYLNELSAESVLFYSVELLPAISKSRPPYGRFH
jgi:hypothetical protein